MLLFGVCWLLVAMFKENRVYIPYAIYTLVQFILIFYWQQEFQKVQKSRYLLLGIGCASLGYLLERYHLGPLFEPMKEHVPTIIGSGTTRSVGLVKSLAIIAPALYFWSKLLLSVIWSILFIRSYRLKNIPF